MGIGNAINSAASVKPLSKRGDRKFTELTGSSKDKFSQASRIPDRVSPENVANAAAAAKQEQIQTKLKQQVGKHLETIMNEANAQHKLHQEHQAKAAKIALDFAKTDAAHVEAIARYLQELGIVRTEAQATVNALDSRMQLELDAIGF